MSCPRCQSCCLEPSSARSVGRRAALPGFGASEDPWNPGQFSREFMSPHRWPPRAGAHGFPFVESRHLLILEGGSSDERTPTLSHFRRQCPLSVPLIGQHLIVLLRRAQLCIFPPGNITELREGGGMSLLVPRG